MKIENLGKIVTGKTPSTKKSAFWGGSIPFVTPKDIQGLKSVDRTERYLTEEGLTSVAGSILPSRAICVSCIGNIGYVGMTTQRCVSNQQINSIIVNGENDPDSSFALVYL